MCVLPPGGAHILYLAECQVIWHIRKKPLQQAEKAFSLVGAEGVEPPTLCL